MRERAKKRVDRPPLPDDKLVVEIKAVIAELPTYGYRRAHAILKRQALAAGLKPSNHKRVYRVMKVPCCLLAMLAASSGDMTDASPTIKRDYARVSPRPDAQTVMHQLSAWINHYNEVHPHKALGYRSPREFIAAHGSS